MSVFCTCVRICVYMCVHVLMFMPVRVCARCVRPDVCVRAAGFTSRVKKCASAVAKGERRGPSPFAEEKKKKNSSRFCNIPRPLAAASHFGRLQTRAESRQVRRQSLMQLLSNQEGAEWGRRLRRRFVVSRNSPTWLCVAVGQRDGPFAVLVTCHVACHPERNSACKVTFSPL